MGTNSEQSSRLKPKSDRSHDLLDKPVANPRYGGQTMREVVLRRLCLMSGLAIPSQKRN